MHHRSAKSTPIPKHQAGVRWGSSGRKVKGVVYPPSIVKGKKNLGGDIKRKEKTPRRGGRGV